VKRGETSFHKIGWVGGGLLKVFVLILDKEAGLITKQNFGTASVLFSTRCYETQGVMEHKVLWNTRCY